MGLAGGLATNGQSGSGGGGSGVSSLSNSDGYIGVSASTGAVVLSEGATLTSALAAKAPLASPALTGTPTAPTQSALTNNTDIATTAYADLAVGVETSRAETAEALLAPKASPTFTGTVTVPTTVNSTDPAQKAYVDASFRPTFGSAGVQAVKTGQGRWYAPVACSIEGAYASVGTAPTGATFIIDILKNGTTIYTGGTNRPTISTSAFVSTIPVVAPAVTALAAGDYLTVNVAQIGSSVPGSDLTVLVLIN